MRHFFIFCNEGAKPSKVKITRKEYFMAQFTNQAQLSYNNTVTNSNIAVGEIVGSLTISKTAVNETYTQGDTVTYVINIVSTGTAANGLTLSDDLGAYTFGQSTLVPLTYVDGSVKYFINGILQPQPTVTQGGTDLIISGINVPAGGNTAIVYEALVNQFAPLDSGSEITNTATLSGTGITPITATETITVQSGPLLSITKSISPVPVAENGTVTYTFLIQNIGNTEASTEDNVILTDTFDPILTNVTASFNGTAWTEGTEYTYNDVTGLFATTSGAITVPGATYTQDPVSGVWQLTPGSVTLTVTGTI